MASGGIMAFTRDPSARRASTIGELSSTRRPTRETMRSNREVPDQQDLSAQCLKLSGEVGDLFCAVRKLQGLPPDPPYSTGRTAVPPVPYDRIERKVVDMQLYSC